MTEPKPRGGEPPAVVEPSRQHPLHADGYHRVETGPPQVDRPIPVRSGLLVAEIVALVTMSVLDFWFAYSVAPRAAVTVGFTLTPVAAVTVLSVLRRRFLARLGLLSAWVLALSLAEPAVHVIVGYAALDFPVPISTATILALALLVGSGCRHLGRWPALVLAGAAGVAMAGLPLLWTGFGSRTPLLAVPAALLWGSSVAVGLILRDGDARRSAERAEIRSTERIRLAQGLHDLVTHHISGIVVRAQAADLLATSRAAARADDDWAGTSAPAGEDVAAYREIEAAGADALTAMRRLVGMLRTDNSERPAAAPGIRAAVLGAVAGDRSVSVSVAAELDDVPTDAELSTTLYWLILEALTNIRRHAPDATEVQLQVRLEQTTFTRGLVLDIVNDGVSDGPRGNGATGYGLLGMAERVRSHRGILHVGCLDDRRWRVTARFPLDPATRRPSSDDRGAP